MPTAARKAKLAFFFSLAVHLVDLVTDITFVAEIDSQTTAMTELIDAYCTGTDAAGSRNLADGSRNLDSACKQPAANPPGASTMQQCQNCLGTRYDDGATANVPCVWWCDPTAPAVAAAAARNEDGPGGSDSEDAYVASVPNCTCVQGRIGAGLGDKGFADATQCRKAASLPALCVKAGSPLEDAARDVKVSVLPPALGDDSMVMIGIILTAISAIAAVVLSIVGYRSMKVAVARAAEGGEGGAGDAGGGDSKAELLCKGLFILLEDVPQVALAVGFAAAVLEMQLSGAGGILCSRVDPAKVSAAALALCPEKDSPLAEVDILNDKLFLSAAFVSLYLSTFSLAVNIARVWRNLFPPARQVAALLCLAAVTAVPGIALLAALPGMGLDSSSATAVLAMLAVLLLCIGIVAIGLAVIAARSGGSGGDGGRGSSVATKDAAVLEVTEKRQDASAA